MAGKCNEGQLTSEERAEYKAYAQPQAVVGPWAGWRNDAKPQREGECCTPVVVAARNSPPSQRELMFSGTDTRSNG